MGIASRSQPLSILFCSSVCLVACAEQPARIGPAKAIPAKPLASGLPAPTWPEGAIAPRETPRPCVARLELSARRDRGVIHLEGSLTSNLETAVEVTLRSPCPGGPISLTGLGDGFDYYATCRQGACRTTHTTVQLAVPTGGATVKVIDLSWPESGDGCRSSLAPGHYDINAWGEVESPEGTVLCGMAHATLDIPAVPPSPKPAPSAPVCKPMPTCGIACESGRFARDAEGCPVCGCEDDRIGVEPTR